MNGVIHDTRRDRHSRPRRRSSDIVRLVLSLGTVWCASMSLADGAPPFPPAENTWRPHVTAQPLPEQETIPKIERKARIDQEDRSLNTINPSSKVQPVAFSPEEFLKKPLAEVIVEGNDTILSSAILQKVECRAGRQATEAAIKRDISQLMNTRWFYSVKSTFREGDEGPILVYQVVERPILKSVTFVGNKKIKTSELQAQTGLRPDHVYDVAANQESVHRIKQLYKEKGFLFAEVTLEKGSRPDERDVVFRIVEGPKSKIRHIYFEGNTFATDAILKTKISSKTLKLWLIQGDYDPEVIRNDALTLKQYYMSLGFFDVDVQADEVLSEDRAKVTVVFTINEGRRYKVDSIDVIGNDVIGGELLLKDLKLSRGDYFNERFLKEDVQRMTDLYDEQGRLFAKVVPTPRFREGEEALVDLVYAIDEDVPRYIGTINVHIAGDYPHSKEEVVRQQVNRWLRPGQLARSSDLRMAQARVTGSGLWDKTTPPAFDIAANSGADYWIPPSAVRGQDIAQAASSSVSTTSARKNVPTIDEVFGHSLAPAPSTGREILGEVPAAVKLPSVDRPVPARAPAAVPTSVPVSMPAASTPGPAPARPRFDGPLSVGPEAALGEIPRRAVIRSTSPMAEPVAASPSLDAPALGGIIDPDLVFRAQSDDSQFRSQSLDAYAQPVPQNFIQGVSPQGNPLGNVFRNEPPGFVDVNIDVTEGRTGRLMFGVGVNSDAGLVGSLVLQEDNFDLLRPPTSFADILNGTAWRGAGQSFRLEAVPGTQVSRYMMSWTDPYFLRSDFSLGVNAFYFNRFYQDWTEERLGGRISLGYVLSKYWSANSFVRLEDVGISRIPAVAPPPDLLAVRGSNFLSTAGVALQYDARDNSFFPTRGNYANFNYEQGFGDFNYPRFELTGGQYFTTYERPDGFGKQILSLTGQVGYTGDNTPVFERFFAGGYSSFRGFYFRGVSPEVNNVKVGGNFMALGSLEYSIPVTASDNIRTVFFTDFGTVEPDVSLDDFRVTAGFGFRLTIPAMGPAPLAFDFAWPLKQEPTDRLRVFSFYVGLAR